MRIGIDARFFGPSVGTGIGRYSQRLIEELELIDRTNEYVVFLRDENIDLYEPKNPRFSKTLAPWRWYSISEQRHFPSLVRKTGVHFMHYLHFNVPLFAPRPFIVTIHDLILSKYPTVRASTLEPVRYFLKQLAYRVVIRSAINRAERLLTVTEHTKNDIVGHFGYPRDRIVVTYEGFDQPNVKPLSGSVLTRYGVTAPFFLCVGNAYPHKNLERLVDAMITLRKRGRKELLVLVGRDDFFYRRLKEYVRSKQADAYTVFTGYVDDDVLDAFYREARLLVFPSKYEGFGLPGLEAMARGIPVVAARASCLPEVYGDAAEYFDPDRTDDIADTVERVVSDGSRIQILRSAGLQRIKRYSWLRMAEQTLAVYNTVGAKKKR
ncbi:MAG: glycosyltransferase family 1 protein [Candidatus Kerfeldbacteria bacterium]